MRRALLSMALVSALLASACSRPSQIIVHVDADDAVKGMTNSLRIRVWGRATDEAFDDQAVQFETGTEMGEQGLWPWLVALRPEDDDPERIWRIEATGYTGLDLEDGGPGGRFVAVARSSAAYEPGQIRHVYLRLRDACIGRPCEDPDTTCIGAEGCVPIPDPTFFQPEAGLPDAGAGMDAARRDTGVERVDGGPVCTPVAETCNGLNDDCDANVDEDFDLETDADHCGTCNTSCPNLNGAGACVGGDCEWTCNDGWLDCETVPGCETPSDAANCGICDLACPSATPICDNTPATPVCVATCPGGATDCGGSCENTMTSTVHCGGCDMACPTRDHASVTCAGGSCVWSCNTGRGDCNGDLNAPRGSASNGCETSLTTTSNCGICGVPCGGSFHPQCGFATCATGTCDVGVVMPAPSCDLGGCTGLCVGAFCTGSCPIDAGTGPCSTCSSPDVCCNGVECCDVESGEFCNGTSCQTPPPDAGGGGPCGSCSPPNVCCGGVTCCDIAGGNFCNGSSCETMPPDAGGGGPCGGACSPAECCGGVTCCDLSGGNFCNGSSCESPPPDAGGGGPCGGACSPAECCGGVTCCDLSGGNFCNGSSCETTPPDAGGFCSTCFPPNACCNGVACCNPATVCNAGTCMPIAAPDGGAAGTGR